MNIKVLGSGCNTTKNNGASYLIDDKILFDVPNGTCKTLMKLGVDPNTIMFVILTHFHGDHYFDLPFLLLGKIKKGKIGTIIYCDKTGKSKIIDLTKLAFPGIVKRLREDDSLIFNNKESFSLKKYNIERVLVDHGNLKPSYGYIFSYDNKRVGFTGDSSLCDSVKNMASKCNYLICDCNFLIGNKKHMGIDNLLQLASDNIKCHFYATHLNDETRKELLKIKKDNITVLDDEIKLNF